MNHTTCSACCWPAAAARPDWPALREKLKHVERFCRFELAVADCIFYIPCRVTVLRSRSETNQSVAVGLRRGRSSRALRAGATYAIRQTYGCAPSMRNYWPWTAAALTWAGPCTRASHPHPPALARWPRPQANPLPGSPLLPPPPHQVSEGNEGR